MKAKSKGKKKSQNTEKSDRKREKKRQKGLVSSDGHFKEGVAFTRLVDHITESTRGVCDQVDRTVKFDDMTLF